MGRMMCTAVAVAVACAWGALTTVPVEAQAVNVTGEWTFSVQTGQGSGTPTMTFKQEGEKLTGHYDGQLGSADLSGTIKGAAIHFTFTVDVQGQSAPVTYDGTVDKNTMKGTMDIAGAVNGSFTATRK